MLFHLLSTANGGLVLITFISFFCQFVAVGGILFQVCIMHGHIYMAVAILYYIYACVREDCQATYKVIQDDNNNPGRIQNGFCPDYYC